MTSARVRALIASATCCSIVVVAAGCAQTESFTRPPAPIVPSADCAAPDIMRALSDNGLGHFVGGAAPTSIELGSLPSGFVVQTVVRCERAVTAAGDVVIDAVTLSGDVEAVSEALDRPSEREIGNSRLSCTFGEDAPAGLWLVASDGSAVRPQWPTVVCGYRDEPLAAVNALDETNRATVPTLGSASVPGSCPHSSGYVFTLTSDSDSDSDLESNAAPDRAAFDLMVPTRDVSDLTLCRYDTDPDGDALVGARTLSADVSRVVATQSLESPRAGPCDQVATEVVAGRLVRPDGSGGGVFIAEVDGCTRVLVPGVTGYRQLPNELHSQFAE